FSKDFSRSRERIWDEMKFLFNDYLIAGERVLDLGCGNGRFYELFKRQNIDYIGVDISEKLIDIAKKRYPKVKFQKVDALNLAFPENFFDKVYSIAVLHHIPSQEFRKQFLKEIKRVLKPRGILILTVWNLWQKRKTKRLISKFILRKILGKSKLDFKDILMNWQKMENCYFHCFTKGELEKLITKAGFHLKRSGEILVGREVKKLPNSNFYIIAEK
ncbi:unnamed protein product, partial [marine sediment metagenome]